MKTRWKVLIGLAVVLAALLALNTIVLNQQTKGAEVTVDGGEIIACPAATSRCSTSRRRPARPRRPDRAHPLLSVLAPLVGRAGAAPERGPSGDPDRPARPRRLEKPASGYSIEDQAGLVAGALTELDVQGAVVVGQSMGAGVAVALAEQSSQLVDRVVDMSPARPTTPASCRSSPASATRR